MTTNLYRALREILPEAPLLVGDVSTLNLDGSITVTFPGGGEQRVRGADVSTGDRVFVRNGVIEGPAPVLPFEDIEV
ncbi:MAG: hypothetical protein J0H69_19475 [Burkholderiales bacterium]|nr:hypothetical protein [Burkholderiales bacterium]